MAKANDEATPKGITLLDGKATTNGNPFSNAKPTVNGSSEPNEEMTNGLGETSSLTVKSNVVQYPMFVRKYRNDLGFVCGQSFHQTDSLEEFLDFIARDRLRHMPHKGSKRDKILRWAEYFGTQISEFYESLEDFEPNSRDTAQLIWTCCRVLIQMGEKHIDDVGKIMGVLYKMSLRMSSILRNQKLFTSNLATERQLSATYAELLAIVVEITMTYHKRSKGTSSLNADDIDKLFGKKLDLFFFHRDEVSNLIWACQLEQNTSISVEMGTIRRWLAPQDRIIQLLASDTMNSRGARDEFTCEWFQSHLLDFSRSSDQTLVISGESGSGKSILSGWIAERLERALGGKSYVVNSVIIDSALKSEAKPLRILQRLLLQSLDQNVGDVGFYQHLSAAFGMSASANDVSEVEEALWLALDIALDIKQNVMIIIDGFDKTVGHQFLDRLSGVCSNHRSSVKCIVLTNEPQKAIQIPHRKFSLQPEHDLQKFIHNSLASNHHFHNCKEQDRKDIVHHIFDAAKGNFMLADLIIQLLLTEQNHNHFMHAAHHPSKSVPDVLEKLIARLDLSKAETKLIVSWLLVSERPLTLLEIQALLEVNVSTKKRNRIFDVEDRIRQCGPLIEIKDGIVRFRHTMIHQHLYKAGKMSINLREAHSDFTLRCLKYVDTHVTSRGECSVDELESSKIQVLFQKNHLLEYTSRYWTKHFGASLFYRQNGKHEVTEDFRHSFSGSVLLAQIERSCWGAQYSVTDALKMHKLALSIRRIINDTHESVLQCTLTIASSYKSINQTVEASSFYYQATTLSRKILGDFHIITTVCAENYLTCTQDIVFTKRTDITTCKEEIIKVLITAHEHHHSTENVIRFKKLLANLYVEIQEITLANKVYRESYDICVAHFGAFHSETIKISHDLTLVLQRGSRHEDVLIYVRNWWEESERTMEIYDLRRLNITVRLCEIYESNRDFIQAETLLIQFWRKISIACRSRRSVELLERKIEIALCYVRFLRRVSRYEEACAILRGLWIEHRLEEIHSESLIVWIQRIAKELNELRILDVAIQAYSYVWNFYKRIHKQFCAEAVEVGIILAKISIEIRTDETFTEETTYIEEEILQEIYESTITTITTTTVTETHVKTIESLSAFYAQTSRWSQTVKVCLESLKKLWPGICHHGKPHGKPSLPKKFASETVEIAIRLATSYLHEHQVEKAEETLVYIFHATKSHLRIQDILVTKTAEKLVLFYEERNRPDRVIDVLGLLLEGYSRGLGKSHSLTLKVLYRLGGLCVKHGKKKEAEHYYLEIYTNLNKDSDVCHHGAIEAALALTKIYYSEKRWERSETIYKCLWQTVLTCTKQYEFTTDLVEEIYQKYYYVLEVHVKASYTVLRQATIEFREVCIHVYGDQAEITLKAKLRLAEICERSETHIDEAIQIYQEVCKETTTISITTVTEAKSKLSRLYIIHSSTSTEHVSKIISLQMECFVETKSQYGCSHDLTINRLEEMAVFYKSRNDQKLTLTILRTLKSLIIDVVIKEKDSKRLFECSFKLAKIYVENGHKQDGYDLLIELRRQIISRDTRNSGNCGFKFEQSINRTSFVFLATFEESLKNTKEINFSEIMADFLVENLLHEAYTRSTTEKSTSFETTMAHGSRLLFFRRTKYDFRDSLIDDELYEAFRSNTGSGIKTSATTTRYFFNILLEEVGRSQQDVRLVKTGSLSGAAAVRVLLEQSKFQDAYELSLAIFQFTESQDGYNDQEIIDSGFKLALYLAGRGAQPCPEKDPKRMQMMELSRSLVQAILEASRHIHVDFTKTDLVELNELVTLLGAQQNFADLEWLLTQLWHFRHETSWSAQSIICIGRRLVEVRFVRGDHKGAIHLWEDCCYNTQRVWGPLDPITLQNFSLLSELYTAVGQYDKAMNIHCEILRKEVSDENTTSTEDARYHTKYHLDLLKRAYQRLGRLDQDEDSYATLFTEIKTTFKGDFNDLQPITKWSTKGADDKGTYKAPSNWQILAGEEEKKHQNYLRRVSGVQRYDMAAKGRRFTSGLHTYIEHIH